MVWNGISLAWINISKPSTNMLSPAGSPSCKRVCYQSTSRLDISTFGVKGSDFLGAYLLRTTLNTKPKP